MNSFCCNKLVFSSSATIYKSKEKKLLGEDAEIELISEDSEIEAINPYGNTKLVIEMFLDTFKSALTNGKL